MESPLSRLRHRADSLRRTLGPITPWMVMGGALALAGLAMLARQLRIESVAGVFVGVGSSWMIAGALANFHYAARAFTGLRRMGTTAVLRPRGWWEIARILAVVAIYSVSLSASLIAAREIGAPIPIGPLNTGVAATACIAVAVYGLFLGSAFVGYVIAVLEHRLRYSQAFEFVHFHFFASIGTGFILHAFWSWPPDRGLLDSVFQLVEFIVRMLVLGAGGWLIGRLFPAYLSAPEPIDVSARSRRITAAK